MMTLNELFMLVGVTLGGLASFMLAVAVLLQVVQGKGR